jgi:predicted phosphodiesterase
MAIRVIFSDLHFGDSNCSLRRQAVARSVRSFLRKIGKVDALILNGDILEANLAPLTKAIEGVEGTSAWPRQIGLRKWLSYIFEGDKFKTGKIIYIPGNHDYIVWNILSTNRIFVDQIFQGKIPKNLPLTEDEFVKPFIRGVAPDRYRNKFIVNYPDYMFELGKKKVLVTHGHYLDKSQTLYKDLKEYIKDAKGDKKKGVRDFFIATAQYQALANLVSYRKSTRGAVKWFYEGPYKVTSFMKKWFNPIATLRNKPINKDTLKTIEMYLSYHVGGRSKTSDVFIYGHTHRPGRSNTSKLEKRYRLIRKDIDVWNDGGFFENKKTKFAGSFIVTDDKAPTQDQIQLYYVDLKGNIARKKPRGK